MKLSEVAKITVSGQELPTGQDMENFAFLVHSAALHKAKLEGGQHQVEFGLPGIVLHASLRSIVRSLWPEKQHEEVDEFSKPLYEYLKRNHCVRLLSGRGSREPVWWICESFNRSTPTSKGASMSAAEKKVTPEEAGEDRKPGKVLIIKSREKKRKRKAPRAYQMADGDPASLILNILLEFDRPMSPKEFQRLREAGRQTDVPSEWTVRRHIPELEEAGLVQVRHNPKPKGRPHSLIAHAEYEGDWVFKQQKDRIPKPRKNARSKAKADAGPQPEPQPQPQPQPQPEPETEPAATKDRPMDQDTPPMGLAQAMEAKLARMVDERIQGLIEERDALAAQLKSIQDFLNS